MKKAPTGTRQPWTRTTAVPVLAMTIERTPAMKDFLACHFSSPRRNQLAGTPLTATSGQPLLASARAQFFERNGQQADPARFDPRILFMK